MKTAREAFQETSKYEIQKKKDKEQNITLQIEDAISEAIKNGYYTTHFLNYTINLRDFPDLQKKLMDAGYKIEESPSGNLIRLSWFRA